MYKNRLPEVIAHLPELVQEALKGGAERVAAGARERVDLGPDIPHLRDVIHVESVADGLSVVAGDKDVFWGHLVEHGTNHSAPHPFLVPAFEQERASIEDDVRAALRRAVE